MFSQQLASNTLVNCVSEPFIDLDKQQLADIYCMHAVLCSAGLCCTTLLALPQYKCASLAPAHPTIVID